ncbi:MAG TPA: PilW family protein [Thermoanaerobaculia bacterium]|nr:PilW family protein [Thermoanaerobaculia bacterium]
MRPRPERHLDLLPIRQRVPQRGFTVIELTVSLFVTVIVILGALMLFDFNSKLAKVQTQIADMHQELRVGQYELVRMTRMAGRGGLPAFTTGATPAWGALSVRNNAGTNSVSSDVAIGYPGTPQAVIGTDILTVRGVLSTPVFLINTAAPGVYVHLTAGGNANQPPDQAATGTIDVCDSSPAGFPQPLDALAAARANGVSEALILVSATAQSVYGVVELDPANTTAPAPFPGGPATCKASNFGGMTVAFHVNTTANSLAFQKLSSAAGNGLPLQLTSVGAIGIVEEYRYYVRQDFLTPGDQTTEPTPHLSRARMFPGTESPWNADASQLTADVADNVLDLQAALGIDVNQSGTIEEDSPPSTTDEWLYNAVGDKPTLNNWSGKPMFYARISLLVRTQRRDPQYQAPVLNQIEDHVYLPTDPINTRENRMYRRRLLQTVAGLRNL